MTDEYQCKLTAKKTREYLVCFWGVFDFEVENDIPEKLAHVWPLLRYREQTVGFWQEKWGSKRVNVSSSLLWLLEKTCVSFACQLLFKSLSSSLKKKKQARGSVSLTYTHTLACPQAPAGSVLCRTDGEVSLMCMRHMKIAWTICISLCSACLRKKQKKEPNEPGLRRSAMPFTRPSARGSKTVARCSHPDVPERLFAHWLGRALQ